MSAATKLAEPWFCQECGKKFTTVEAAQRAMSKGCPKCNGSDINCAPRLRSEAA